MSHYYAFKFSPLGEAAVQEAVRQRDEVEAQKEDKEKREEEERRVSVEGREERVMMIRMLRTGLRKQQKAMAEAVNLLHKRVDLLATEMHHVRRASWAIRTEYDAMRMYTEQVIDNLEEEVGLSHEARDLGTEAEVRKSLRPTPEKKPEDEE
jgi:hypothetical protein